MLLRRLRFHFPVSYYLPYLSFRSRPRLELRDFSRCPPDELQMSAELPAPGAPAIILDREDRDDCGNTGHENDYYRIKILKEEGRKYATEIPFFKENGNNIVNVHARTVRPDGSITNF